MNFSLHKAPLRILHERWEAVTKEALDLFGSRGVTLFCRALSKAGDYFFWPHTLGMESVDNESNRIERGSERLLVELARALASRATNFAEDLLERFKGVYNEHQLAVLISLAGLTIASDILLRVTTLDSKVEKLGSVLWQVQKLGQGHSA